MDAPLKGLRVLDLTRLLPGGYATLLLADLGADVVKVEQPGRGDYIRFTPPLVDGTSAAHLALNRNKRSVALDLKTPEDRDRFMALACAADVLVESFRPGVMDRLGCGYAELSARNPGLVYCAITGYGQDGPRAAEAGHDLNYVARAGLLDLNGPEGGPPVPPAVQVGDLGGGAMVAVVSVLAALVRRSTTGRGSFCDVAMAEGALSWLTLVVAEHLATGELPRRGRTHLTGAYPCYRVYPAADGHVAVAALEPQFWTELCSALGRPDLAGEAFATGARRDEVVADLEAVFASATRAEWERRLAGRDVCVAPVYDLAEALADPQVRHRGVLVEDPGSPLPALATPVRLDGAPPLLRRPAPALGEHTSEVLAEWGATTAR